ncbi:hypothetical protein EDM52_05715 [Brevibacillus invocatus]|uniref:Uncharacterized protein n=1 Tax=Brevibacillus invocatus TaxID=173959 RepID=A0A3M8CM05_9BACL|nr:hypothetical protein EDM52_05715 [Brevibacillus invocatus]
MKQTYNSFVYEEKCSCLEEIILFKGAFLLFISLFFLIEGSDAGKDHRFFGESKVRGSWNKQ